MSLFYDYRLDIKTAAGVIKHQVNDFEWLYASKGVNRPGTLRAQFYGLHDLIGDLEHKSQIELWRRSPVNGVDFYRWFSGLYLRPKWDLPGYPRFELTAIDDKWLLGTRVVAWAAETANRSLFTSAKAETVMKTIVDYNCGPNATTANGRLLKNGTITGLSIQADSAGGNTVTWRCFGKVVLKTLQELAPIAGGDFDLVKTGAATWQFRFYLGQLGSDKTSTVIFSIDRGNMSNPRYQFDRINEVTSMIAGGKSTGADREFTLRTGPDYSGSNDVEGFFDGSSMELAALQFGADQRLNQLRAQDDFDFDVIQNDNTVFDKDYFLGDLAKVVNPFTGASYNRKVDFATITLSRDGEESIDIELVPQ